MGISLEEAMEYDLIDEGILKDIPSYCKCGSPLEISNNIDKLGCTTNNCSDIIAIRIESMLKQMGVQGWNIGICRDIVRAYKLKSPYQVFFIPSLKAQGNTSNIVNELELLKSACDPENRTSLDDCKKNIRILSNPDLRQLNLVDYVKYSNIDTISQLSKQLFYGFDSIEEAYSYIKLMEVPFISSRLGLKSETAIALAIYVYNKALESESELIYGEKFFKIKNTSGIKINLVADDKLDIVRNVNELVDLIDRRYSGKFKVIVLPNITNQTDAFISAGYSNSIKYIKVNNINEQHRFRVERDMSINKSTISIRQRGKLRAPNEKIFNGTVKELLDRLDSLSLEV